MAMEAPSRSNVEKPEDVEKRLEEGLKNLAEANNMSVEQLNGLMSVRSSQPAYKHVENPFYKGPPVPIEDSQLGRFIEQHHTIKGTVGEDGTSIMVDRHYRGPEPRLLSHTRHGIARGNQQQYTEKDFTSYKATIDENEMDRWKDAPGLYEHFAKVVEQRDVLMQEAKQTKEAIAAFVAKEQEEQRKVAEVTQDTVTRDALMAKVLGRKES